MESDTKSGAAASEVDAPAPSDSAAASGSSGRKRKTRTPEVIEPRTPVKRQRVPVSRFQSPLEDVEPKFKSETEEKKKEENITLYKKGAFLAVRGAEGTFYLCRTAQNVYSKSRRLRIQWLSVDTPPNDYKFDYVDSTEMETVLTEIKMDKISKDIYRLPGNEKKRIETILDRALRVEKGIATADEVEEEALEDAKDLEEEEDDDDDEPPKSRKRTPKTQKAQKVKKSPGPTPAQKKKLKEKEKVLKEKKKAKEKAEKKTKVKGPDRNLKPNPKIKVLEKDPFFETKDKVPEISPLMTSKLVFRAVNTNSLDDLKALFEKTEGITNFDVNRSAKDNRCALEIAGEQGKKEFIKLLTDEMFNTKAAAKKKRKAPPAPIISSVGTGSYNPAYLGLRAIRSLNVSRGNREGNDAFLKEEQYGNVYPPDLLPRWMEHGVQEEVLETFLMALSVAEETTRDDQIHLAIDHISNAISRGHYKLAGKFVAEAERLGGFGFNYLHKEVLTFETEDLRDIILAASVRKKPFSNDAITPLHCAAINPNVKYLTRLLSIEPDINLQTRSRARPIHFAAACEGTAPLEFLLKRNASPNEADSSGNLPIHFASRSGRSKNIEVLLKHAKTNAATEVVSEKWGLGNVNRPNRFAMCPLHLAVEEGHLDAVKTLIKYGADVNKCLSAGKDKVTPLMIAAQRGDLPLARILIQSGAAVEILDKMKRSALTHAIMNGSANVASYLLYLGADPNRVDSSNNTLVHYAAAYGWHYCLKLLLKDAGAKPDEPNIWQTTPIGIAFLKGNYGLVEMLFQNKDVNIDFKTDDGMTLASTACKSRLVPGLDSQIKSLIQNFKADPTIKDVNGFNALHHLAANDIKVQGSYWNRAVDKNAMEMSVKIAEILIAAGCDPTLRTNEGKTPTMLAIEQVNVDLVRFLVEHGGTVSPDKNTSEKTVLHLMAEQCCATNLTPMLHILAGQSKAVASVEDPKAIKENGKVNNVDHVQEKKTPAEPMEVDSVAQTNSGDGAENKVANDINGEQDAIDAKGDGASVSKESKEPSAPSQIDVLRTMAKERDFVGFTPFLRACLVYRTFKANKKEEKEKAQYAREFIEALLELTESDVNAAVGPKNMPDEPEEHYAPEGKMCAVHMLVNVENEDGEKSGAGMGILFRFAANPNLKDKDNKTPLVLAVEGSRKEIAKLLLENGADPNVEINHGYYKDTPLVLATNRGSLEIMRMLIQYKADVTRYRSDSLSTPLHSMVTNRLHEDETIAMLQLLLQNGANINCVDINGNTPLHLAVSCNKGHSDTSTSLEEFLLESGADMMAKDNAQNMPLHLAVNKKGTDPIELCSLLTSMMRDQRVDEPNKNGYTPLLYAASSGATICCMHLLQRGAKLEARESRGNTPLNMAIYGGFDSCAIMLMQRNASLNFPIVVSVPHTVDPTKEETEEDKKKKKRPLLNWRPKLQWQNRQPRHFPGETMTIFEGAVKKDLTGVAHMLLDGLGMPMEAVEAALNLSKFYLALRLIRRIPDVSRLHAKNKEGQNLFHVLANKTSRNDPELQLKVAAALLEKRVPLGESDKRGVTPLMYAALKHQSVKLAKFLIDYDRNFSPKVKDSRNRDIMAAFMWDYSWISDNFKLTEVKDWMDTLIDKGGISLDTLYDHPLPDPLLLGAQISSPQPEFFDATQAGKGLTSPLIFAIRNYNFGLAKFMLQKGASPNFPDGEGITPLMHAIQMNDVKMVKLLLNRDYEDGDGIMQEQTALKPQLSNEPSRQVMTINFEVPAKDNPDDILDENADEDDEEDQVSLSKHTEENEDSVDLEEDDEPEDEEPEEDEPEDDEDDEENDDAGGDSDNDTDVVDDDEEPEEEDVPQASGSEGKPNLPSGAMKLTLTRHVSQITKERVFESVAKTSSVDLSKADPRGWTALHHAVCPLAAATFDNTEIIFLLCKAGAPLDVQNKAGDTAADLARKHNAEKIFKQLQKLGLKDDKPFVKSPEGFSVEECVPDKTKPDIKADSEAMLNKLDAAAGVKPDSDDSPSVDNNCDIKKTGEVARSETNIPYSVTLSKVDVTCGTWGMYNFYKLQIVQHTAKKLFILFTRWGRIGDRGQFQHTPFQTLAEAAKEFCKIYKSKTGNDWNQKTPFQNHPKKYRLMPKAEKQHKQHKVDFNFESSVTSKLPEPLFDLLSEMSSVNMLEASIKKVGLNEDFMPFGRMKRETLLEARRVLTDISELIEKVVKLRNNLTTDLHAEYQSNCEEIAKLTNEYYHLVPIHGFEYETIQPISEKKMLREHTKLLADLMDLQVANTILLGANLRKSELNPIDYIYSSLGCRIQPMAEDDPQTQFILTNIHASAPSARINRVFRVAREEETERLAALNMPNHQLLWHGSSMSNFISILSRGLLVTPPEVPWTGHLFGEGIYFADTFVKSANYCHNHSNKSTCKVMLLCEVALGNPKVDVKHGDEDHLDDDINSLKILGLKAPIPDFDALLPFGATLSLGQIQPMKYHPPARITHNEFIIHNAEQVAIRYLVLYNG